MVKLELCPIELTRRQTYGSHYFEVEIENLKKKQKTTILETSSFS